MLCTLLVFCVGANLRTNGVRYAEIFVVSRRCWKIVWYALTVARRGHFDICNINSSLCFWSGVAWEIGTRELLLLC